MSDELQVDAVEALAPIDDAVLLRDAPREFRSLVATMLAV